MGSSPLCFPWLTYLNVSNVETTPHQSEKYINHFNHTQTLSSTSQFTAYKAIPPPPTASSVIPYKNVSPKSTRESTGENVCKMFQMFSGTNPKTRNPKNHLRNDGAQEHPQLSLPNGVDRNVRRRNPKAARSRRQENENA